MLISVSMPAPSLDVDALRRDTPGCAERIHLNNAGASLVPRPVIDTVVAHLELEGRIGGYEAKEAADEQIAAVYASAARLVNAGADEIALLENGTRAWDAAFYAIGFRPGDRIVTARAEYASNYMAYLQVARQTAAEIVVIGDDGQGQIDLDELERTLREPVKLVSISHVPTSGGLVNPAAEVGRLARAAGALFLLDAIQSVGQMPLDVQQIGCDFLAATGRKYLRGPRGTGFLYVGRDRLDELHPAFVEVGGARWTAIDSYELTPGARRFETWEASYALQLGLGRAIDYALDAGVEATWRRVVELAAGLRARLAEIPGVTVRDLGATKCGIVTFTVDGADYAALRRELTARNVNVYLSTMSDTRLDLEPRGLELMVRASVHYFNTEAELDRFAALVAELRPRS
jgi:cysteine desulfurase / selenocysteine lyase